MSGRLPLILLFVVITFCCWGTYGPTLHIGQEAMGHGRLRPFIGVGIAYFIVAVIIPLIVEPRINEPGRWTLKGIIWSLLAGTIGALGSLGIIFAFNSGGKPVFVMPLVFGCAPVVNTIVTMLTSKSKLKPGIMFYLGIGLVALGAAGVLTFKPKATPTAVAMSAESQEASEESVGDDAADSAKVADAEGATDEPAKQVEAQSWLGWFATVGSILLTAVCWGCYGPTLHQGQAKMHGSRLRPFIGVGVAYFVVAIMIPAALLMNGADQEGSWKIAGLLWSLAAGGLGAIGALGVIMAFTFGGKPTYVMPLVFGGAPIINTVTSMAQSYAKLGTIGQISWQFIAALGTVIVGAVLVLMFAPKAAPHKPEVQPLREGNDGGLVGGASKEASSEANGATDDADKTEVAAQEGEGA